MVTHYLIARCEDAGYVSEVRPVTLGVFSDAKEAADFVGAAMDKHPDTTSARIRGWEPSEHHEGGYVLQVWKDSECESFAIHPITRKPVRIP